MPTNTDITITCRQCGKDFIFTAAEQEFYKQKGYAQPLHCRECRANRRSQTPFVCSKCGTELKKGTSVYCLTCQTAVQVEFELEVRKIKAQLDEAYAKLNALEAERANLKETINAKLASLESEKKLRGEAETQLSALEAEKVQITASLQQKEEIIAGLQEQLKNVSLELEKAVRYRATLDWIEPAFNKIKESLEAMERNQSNLNKTMLDLIQKNGQTPEPISLAEAFRRLFRSHHKSTAPNTEY